jgi:hypothetical protein
MDPTFFDPAEVRTTLATLIDPGGVFEIRILNGQLQGFRRTGRISGYFNDVELCVSQLERLTGFDGIYITLNRLNRALLARRANRLDYVQERDALTGDQHIERLRFLLLDADPVRVTGVSATNKEKKLAEKKAYEIRKYLTTKHGWSDPIMADSGNGFHLLYPIDLPAEDSEILKDLIARLADHFDDNNVRLDRAVFNPSRIVRLYGTLTAKGDDMPDRPHRPSRKMN